MFAYITNLSVNFKFVFVSCAFMLIFCCVMIINQNHMIIFLTRFMARKHLVDVTEIFRQLNGEKKYRMIKLAFYFCLFIITIYRFGF